MTGKDIRFGGQTFRLLPEGCAYWPSQHMIIVSDLHLEKGSSFLASGVFIPPHDSCETLERLSAVLNTYTPEHLMFLGDSFHDEAAYNRLDDKCRRQFSDLCNDYKVIWIEGNHEKGFVPKGLTSHESLDIEGLVFRHIAEKSNQKFEISGHYHPCATIRHKGKAMRKRCFVESDKRLILPAFGTYTGSLDIKDDVLMPLFPDDFTVHMTGKRKIYSFPSNMLA